MFEYEAMAKAKMSDFRREAETDHRAHLATAYHKHGTFRVGRILVKIARILAAMYRLIVRQPTPVGSGIQPTRPD